MKTVLQQTDPLEDLDEVVALFASAGKTRSHEHFRWYYEDKGFGSPVSWALRDRDSGRLLGLNSVVFRRIRLDDRVIRAGLGGNLLVEPSARTTMGANQLMRISQELIKRRDIDILLGIAPNVAGGSLARASRARPVNFWRTHFFVSRSGQWFCARLGNVAGPIASLLVDSGARLHRAVTMRTAKPSPAFVVRRLSADSMEDLSADAWEPAPGQFCAAVSSRFLWSHFATYPGLAHEMLGLFAADSGQPVACVILVRDKVTGRGRVRLAASDHRYLSESQAIATAVHGFDASPGLWRVEALAGSALDAGLRKAGFLTARKGGATGQVLMAYWRPDHPLSDTFEDAARWNLFQGINDV